MGKRRAKREKVDFGPSLDLGKVFFAYLFGLGVPGLALFALLMWASATFV